MDALCPARPDVLLAASSDGVRNLPGRVSGIFSRVSDVVSDSGHSLIYLWCGPDQLGLFVAAAVGSFYDHNWYSSLTALIGYVRHQQNLVNKCNASV